MKQIKTGLRNILEFLVLLAILIVAAIAPGLLNASSSTITIKPLTHTNHQEIP